MTYRVPNVGIKFQGLNLNCGRYCLEALNIHHHGSKYGVNAFGILRTEHAPEVQKHINTTLKLNFNPRPYLSDYRLREMKNPGSAANWEDALRKFGPIIVGGHIGAVRIIPLKQAGHYLLVVGVNGDRIEYLDPLRPHHALGSDPASLSYSKFAELLDEDCIYRAKKFFRGRELMDYT